MAVSINPFTQKKYTIPKKLDDSGNIDSFLKKNQGKKIIVVQGLGFVGAVMSLVCANSISEEYAVIGIDLPSKETFWKIKSINEGAFPLVAEDPNIKKFYKKSMESGTLYATYDHYAYSFADFIIVDINLDVQIDFTDKKEIKGYDVDLSGFKSAIETISNFCKEDILVLVETTVPPGTCKKIVMPILKKGLEERGLSLDRFKLGHSYERVMPGPDYFDSIQNFYRVYSGINKKSADATESFLRTIIRTDEYPLTRLGSTNASEISKVLENSFRSMNIAFVAEWSRFAEEAGVNLFEVVNAIRMRPTHANLMFPGIGVGGYCLTKDPLLASWARQNLFQSNYKLPQSEISVDINNKMPKNAFDFLVSRFENQVEGKNILLLGVSYRGDVGDTRSSPVDSFHQCFIDYDCNVHLHDPYVSFWEEKNLEVVNELEEALVDNLDFAIISTSHTIYKSKEFLEKLIKAKPKVVYDTLGIFSEEDMRSLQQVSKVCVLGRGDIK